jgi:hypothetical protein
MWCCRPSVPSDINILSLGLLNKSHYNWMRLLESFKKERAAACEEEWKRRSNAHKEAREDWIKWAAQMGYDMKKKKALLILWKGSLILFLLKLQ